MYYEDLRKKLAATDVKRRTKQAKISSSSFSEEVSSIDWEFINTSEQEEDLICRMYKLVRDRYIMVPASLYLGFDASIIWVGQYFEAAMRLVPLQGLAPRNSWKPWMLELILA
ncbi:hypothetical protein ABKV19_017565 [Rosa sericea]